MATQVESLERRVFLAAQVVLQDGVLNVLGTPARDHISFGISPDGAIMDVNVFHDGALVEQQLHNVADVKRIAASLGDGADTFILGEVPIPAFVRGGNGNDSLSGGRGNDTLLGEGGDDYLFGREGNDSLVGGLQGDLILGGRNDDVIVAGSSLINDDTISGGRGLDLVDYSNVTDDVFVHVGTKLPDPEEDDFIYGDVETVLGSPQNDTIINGTRRGMFIWGGDGNDSLQGGSGDDTLEGGLGQNTLTGMGGKDTFRSSPGAEDLINGGTGVDMAVHDLLATLLHIEETISL